MPDYCFTSEDIRMMEINFKSDVEQLERDKDKNMRKKMDGVNQQGMNSTYNALILISKKLRDTIMPKMEFHQCKK